MERPGEKERRGEEEEEEENDGEKCNAKGDERQRRRGREGRHFVAQQCGRQREGEVERERDYCLLESSNLRLCHEYQRL